MSSERPLRTRPGVQRTAVQLGAFAQPGEAVTMTVGRRSRRLAVVRHREGQAVGRVADGHDCGRRRGVLERIGECFLDDSKRAQSHSRGKLSWLALHDELDMQAARAHTPGEFLEVSETSRWPEVGGLVVAEQAEQPAKLGQGITTSLLHCLQDGLRGAGVGVHQCACGAGVEDHDGHAMGDEVMQLTSQSRSLLDPSQTSLLLTLSRELDREPFEERVARAQRPDADACAPRDQEQRIEARVGADVRIAGLVIESVLDQEDSSRHGDREQAGCPLLMRADRVRREQHRCERRVGELRDTSRIGPFDREYDDGDREEEARLALTDEQR